MLGQLRVFSQTTHLILENPDVEEFRITRFRFRVVVGSLGVWWWKLADRATNKVVKCRVTGCSLALFCDSSLLVSNDGNYSEVTEYILFTNSGTTNSLNLFFVNIHVQ